MFNPAPGSPRMSFQYKYMDEYYGTHPPPTDEFPPHVLNIGCADDPLNFGERAHHVDIDDWSYKHKWFTQTDAASLPFPDRSYDLVILGDIMEHVESPSEVTKEACRVCNGKLVITVFEEWRLPGHGQWIKEGHEIGDAETQKLGFPNREAHQQHLYPERKGFDDDKVSHLVHINQFNDQDISSLVVYVCSLGFDVLETLKIAEAVQEGHQWYNWLLAFERNSK